MKNKPYKHAVILMTALLPTIGHKNLIQYASCLADEVNVIISGRSFEPIGINARFMAFSDEFYSQENIKFYFHIDDNAPQNPSSENDGHFWDYWKNVIENQLNLTNKELEKMVVIASESYGKKISEIFKCDFMPYDLNRNINNVKSTNVRHDIINNYNQILPYFQKELKTTATIFGAESCWKTTMSEYLARKLNGYFLFEWARPYLENLNNPEVTEQHMKQIHIGQKALQDHAILNLHDKPFVFQDTDLLSTIGYYKIMDMDVPESIVEDFKETKSEIYYLMASNVTFIPDPLRYGGDKRESNDQFWIDLLEEYECNWTYIYEDTFEKKFEQIKNHLFEHVEKKYYEIKNFIRD